MSASHGNSTSNQVNNGLLQARPLIGAGAQGLGAMFGSGIGPASGAALGNMGAMDFGAGMLPSSLMGASAGTGLGAVTPGVGAIGSGIGSGGFMSGAGPWAMAGNLAGGLLQGTVDPNHSGNSIGNIGGAALKGAGTGAAIGSIVPGVGTLIGGGVGGVLGALSTLI